MTVSPAITVIGCDGGPLSRPAAAALAAARCVAGAPRHLAVVALPDGVELVRFGAAEAGPPQAGDGGGASRQGGMTGRQPASARGGAASAMDAAISAILAHQGPVAVLASGDPGFFGIVRALVARGATPGVIPATSSVALAFARLGLPWEDALVLSAHGRAAQPVLAAALGCGKAAIFTAPGPTAGPERFIPALLAAGRLVYVAECLGAPGERVTRVTARQAEFADPNLVIALDPAGAAGAPGGARARDSDDRRARNGAARGRDVRGGHEPDGSARGARWMAGHLGAPDGWALPEDAFAHRDSMITKAEVRALVLARLGPGPGRTVWDIGSGSGSVAVECARFGAHVIAIEGDPAQCARIRANAAAHGVRLQLAEGHAPGVFAGLLPADAVFAGGGGDAALAAVAAAHPPRVVVALASVDRVRTVRDLLADEGYEVDGTALQASRLAALPGGSIRLAAANPVFVLWGNLR
ncbi:MAG TPA: precorrin-6y C5,15-methyltransferase (decarboxylating) subunit CbiE [Streptosporangiaceae bacterium]|nr:precorrin-6y C5,15-methyltransferase (decarboxylating) subunit CbiE [Streptosporangiaceae bacterium]